MTTKPFVYLDHHATTPCDPRVVEAMLPTFSSEFGNAASRQHAFGERARRLVEHARGQVAALIGCDPAEIVFTSGATESDNLAIKGVALSPACRGRHVVTSALEHRAVLDSCRALETAGFDVTYLTPAPDGRTSAEDVGGAIRDDTALVSVMYANNEIGVVNPVGEIGALCKERGIPFHCDAVQALPYLPCDVESLGIDLLSVSAHKLYGPKGAGALYVRRRSPRVRVRALVDGGGHERGLRSGTLNVSGIVGLGMACELARDERTRDAARVAGLRDRILERLLAELPDARVNGSLEHRLPNNVNLSVPGVHSETLLRSLETVAISSGSACSSAARDGSYVLKVLTGSEEIAGSSLRISPGRFTTADEIDFAAAEIIAAVKRLQGSEPRPSGECSP